MANRRGHVCESFCEHWAHIGQPFVSRWSTVGRLLVNRWPTTRAPLVSRWPIVGQEVANHWSITGQGRWPLHPCARGPKGFGLHEPWQLHLPPLRRVPARHPGRKALLRPARVMAAARPRWHCLCHIVFTADVCRGRSADGAGLFVPCVHLLSLLAIVPRASGRKCKGIP